MLTLTPDTTIPQPVRALGIANTRRSAAATLKTRLRALNVHAIRDGHVNLAAPLGALTDRQRNGLAGRLCP